MTHAELANKIADSLNGKKRPEVRIHSVRHEDMMEIAAALNALTTLYTLTGQYDPITSFDARAVLWDVINEYNLDPAEVNEHPISKSVRQPQ